MSTPLVVNTKDGGCWTRRTVTSSGIALYAPEAVKTCPQFVMATLAELAEHGVSGTAYVLPVPVGPELEARLAEDTRTANEAPIAYTLTEQAPPVHSSHTSWQVEVLDGGRVWLGTGIRADNREAAEDLLTRERNAQPDVQFRLVRATTTYALEPAAEDPCHPCGCPKRFNRHADGCPTQDLREDEPAAPDFFEPGRTYSEVGDTTDWRFRCDSITTHPDDGERTALGWRHFRGEWEPYAYGEDDWEIHQIADTFAAADTTTTGEDGRS